MEEFNLEDTKEQLGSNCWFHFRIHTKTLYNFFGDLDNYSNGIDRFIDILHDFMSARYNLYFDKEYDFKYTSNNGKSGYYHYSIPKWNLHTETLKIIHQELIKAYPDAFINKAGQRETYCVDTTIYSAHWFRCPNQIKGDSNNSSVHKIIFGNLEDFIIEYIPDGSINIDTIIQNPIVQHPSSANQYMIIPTNNITSNSTNSNSSTIISNTSKIVSIPLNSQIISQNIINHSTLLSNALSNTNTYKQLFDSCFSSVRFTSYDNWIKVGMAIKNTINNYQEALQLFDYFSSRGANYEGIESTNKKFNSFKIKDNGYNVGTIYKMALEDNKEQTIAILSANKLELHPTEFCIFIKAFAGNRFFYKLSNDNFKLYCYNGKYWSNNVVLLRHYISQEFYNTMKDILINIYWQSPPNEFISMKTKLDKLKTLNYKNEIIESYKEYNAREDIEFDNKWWLFGFNNIVYDMKAGTFREYEYDDYVSITTGYDWREPTTEELANMTNFINTIMPIENERELFLQILATGIDGNCLEKFILFNGAGGNGKGVVNDCMLTMLGNYGMIGNNSLLFEPSKTGSNPEKANIHMKRYVVFREPPAKKRFENSVIKELTGGGTISSSGHYESDTKKTLCNTTICECNSKPAFSEEITQADQRRIIDFYFRSSFTDNDVLVNPQYNIYKANPELKTSEFKGAHKYALFKILTTYHKKYLENGSKLKLPETTIARTQEYLENNCILTKWFQNEYEQDLPNSNINYVKVVDLLDYFRNSETFENLSKQNKTKYGRNTFTEYIKNSLFFKRFYIERYNNSRNLIKGWHLQNDIEEEIDM